MLHSCTLNISRPDCRSSCSYQLNGWIPWTDIADNPSCYMNKRSCPHSDHKLMEPLHMKAQGVDDWQKHWLKLQKKGKCPLTLRDPSEGQATPMTQNGGHAKEAQIRKGKEKARDTPETSADEQSNGEDSGMIMTRTLEVVHPVRAINVRIQSTAMLSVQRMYPACRWHHLA